MSKHYLLPAWLTGVALLAGGGAVSAQEKKTLTFEQTFGKSDPGITKALPVIKGWEDAEHYIEVRTEGKESKSWSIDVQTGKAAPYAPAQPPITVTTHDNDVFYSTPGNSEIRLTQDATEEQNATLSPDGKYVAFTRGNDLYSVELATKKETRYTTDGTDVVYNGWASWVYYEEILGRPSKYRAFWWSPDSKHIAYMHFDDSQVPMFPIYSEKGQHGFTEKTRYPKAGDHNPEVRVGIVPVTGGATTWADFDAKKDQYFGTPYWTPDGQQLWVQWMNRGQDTLKIYAVTPATGSKKEVYAEYQKTWVEWLDNIPFLDNGKGFLIQTDKSGWSHLYLHNADGSLRKQLTSGNWGVKEVLSIDEKAQLVYFTARKEASTRLDLYQVSLKSGAITRLTSGDYSHAIKLSPGNKYFITTYSNLQTPAHISLLNTKGKVIRELGDAKGSQFDTYQLAHTTLQTYKTRDGLELPITISLPLHVEPGKKYPVLISMYGGPNAGRVYDTWTYNASQQWWAQEGLILVTVDNRSSGHLGKTGMNYIHRKMGIYETEDFIDAAKWIGQQAWADPAKICITGGSFGGYLTCMALTYGADVFPYGIANYSVTDWQLYDSHYTERFMDTPKENPEGYKETSVMTYANKYKGLLRIVHGTMDDNVHLQQSYQLIDTLENMNKHFELMIYPGVRHGWGGPKGIHSRDESFRFYYENLLEKPFPKVFENK